MRGLEGPRKVVLIDDDADVRQFVSTRLRAAGIEVIEAANGERGLEIVDGSIDLVIVDAGLPGIDGFAVVTQIRNRFDMPIVMLTGASDEGDRVLGLELGADDYVVKPFLARELIARVRAHLRRADHDRSAGRRWIEFGDVVIDVDAVEVSVGGVDLALTALEFDLLVFLASSPRQVFSRDQLLQAVWNVEPGWQGAATVTEHIHRLRRSIETDRRHPGIW